MRYESNCGLEVLESLFHRQALLEKGDIRAELYRPALFKGGEVFRGVYGAGCGCAIEQYGLNDSFTQIFGTSTGAASAQFLMSKQIRKCIHIYWKEAATAEFIAFRRWFFGKTIENTQFLSDVFAGYLDMDAFHAALPEFYSALTHAVTGEGLFVNTKLSRSGLHEAVRASFSIPFLCGEPVTIDGEPYYDGVGAMGMPTKEIIEQFRPTDLLVFANAPREEVESPLKAAIEKLVFRNLSPGVRDAFLSRGARFNDGIRYLRQQKDIRWMIVWTEDISLFERRGQVLQRAVRCAKADFSALLAKAKRSFEEKIAPRVA